jgi:hypothetical protein
LNTTIIAPPERPSSAVSPALVSEIVALHGEIIAAARTSLDKAIRIGELLTEQKAKLKHGQWLPWVKENLPFEHATASRYMSVYVRRDEISQREKFGLTDAYRLLSAPAEPEVELFPAESENIPTEPRPGQILGKFIPEPGHMLIGYGDNRGTHYCALIVPHVQDGFYFVNVNSAEAGRDNGPGTMDFLKKAIRGDRISHVLSCMVPHAEALAWEQEPCTERWEYDEIAYHDHQHYMDEVILGKNRRAAA